MVGTALLGVGWLVRMSRAIAPRRSRLLGRGGVGSACQGASYPVGNTWLRRPSLLRRPRRQGRPPGRSEEGLPHHRVERPQQSD